MNSRTNVVVVMARCSQEKGYFGIRFEENKAKDQGIRFRSPKSLWVFDWAFEIKKELGKKEGYDKSVIKGTFMMGHAYPGCPYCIRKSFFKCACGQVACWDGVSQTVTCPSCGMAMNIEGSIESLSAGDDR